MFRQRARSRQIIESLARRFREKGATGLERAMRAEQLGLHEKFESAMKERLGKTGIFVEAGGKYYLDERRLMEFEQRQGKETAGPRAPLRKQQVDATGILEFDGLALFAALDAQRVSRGLSWPQVTREIWELSSALNDRRHDHPISPSTIANLGRRGNTTCQHALAFLRWLGRSPESFLRGGNSKGAPLPEAGPDRRIRWDLVATYEALDARRRAEGMTWSQLARVLGCTPSQLTGLRRARYATGMRLAMGIAQWLGRPAADFVYPAKW